MNWTVRIVCPERAEEQVDALRRNCSRSPYKRTKLLLVPSTPSSKSPSQGKQSNEIFLQEAIKDTAAPRPQRHRGRGAAARLYLEGCLGEQHSKSLLKTSVVICFRDEAWSTLLRTVHSVLDTTPKLYLQEVLLVEDQSQQHEIHPSIQFVYTSQVTCRTVGAAHAIGEVLVFMDHCECQKGWLEPLLERVAQDRSRVVSPIMDIIVWQTFQYNATQWSVRGVFDWRLDFHWESNPQLQDADTELGDMQSPALGGEVVAISRQFFQTVGAYDQGMLPWGPEQAEFSISVWSCGGSMEVVPCSRVPHLIRHHLPSNFSESDILQKNKIRVADSWMDAYRKIFYRRDTLTHFIRQSKRPNVTERLQLKRSLGCRSFHWFLSSVYAQLYIL
ncbi:LOW QUALITY PROTEIN: polypeptide N-acetylgalactosaminyltransferase 15-like [Anableps anableps]